VGTQRVGTPTGRTVEDVVDACRQAGVRLIRFLYCDNGGTVRGKAVHVDRLADRMRTGVGLTLAMQAMSSLDELQPVDGMGPVGELRLVPDPESFVLLPYAPHSAAMLADHVALDGQADEAGPRPFLARMAGVLAERDMALSCGVENEFSLARQEGTAFVPIDHSLCFSTIGMGAAAEVIDNTIEALERQGIAVEQYYAELGHGQQELSVGPRPAVQAADVQVLVRETIRAVAARHDLVASLAPKPWPDEAGNGAHVHLSVWDSGMQRNLFHDDTGRYGLSELAEHFVAGLLAHLPGLLGLTAPTFNSFQRLLPEHWSSAYVCWGPDNREAAVRVPSTFWGREMASANIEYKPIDASCNPYLAFGGLIAAGLDGIDRGLAPPQPVTVDPHRMTPEDREAIGVAPYPPTVGHALDALEQDQVLTDALGETLTRSYLAVRRSEWEADPAANEAHEQARLFLTY
jgi:glutamine synthetase